MQCELTQNNCKLIIQKQLITLQLQSLFKNKHIITINFQFKCV